MIVYLGLILTIIFILMALFSPSYKYPLLLLILVRPIVNATWSFKFADISLIYILNSAFVIIFFLRILLKKDRIYEFPYYRFFLIYLHILIIASINILVNSGIIIALEFFSKSLFIPLAVYLFYTYFIGKKDVKLLISVIILSAMFPLFFTLIQKITGHVWVERQTRGLVRNVGLYHDIVTPRIIIICMLIGLFIYWQYFLNKDDRLKRLVIIFVGCISLYGLFIMYSKAIILTLILWVLMYALLRKKIYILPAAFILILSVNYFTHNRIYNDVYQLFSKEVNFARGEIEGDRVLAGRGMLWRLYFDDWKELPITQKLIGNGVSHTGFHNDFLRILFSGGILLLTVYILLLATIFLHVFFNYFQNYEFIHFAVMLGIVYYMIESLGQLPGMYPDIQTYVWGMAGISLNQNFYWNDSAEIYNEESRE